jgi:hypothetical protein
VGAPWQRALQASIWACESHWLSQAGFWQMPASLVPSARETTAPISTSFGLPSAFFRPRRKLA